MSNIRLINNKRSILDLSAVKDARGEMVILQPKDTPGASRECPADAAEHPHVVAVLEVGWVHIEKVSLAPAAAPVAVSAPIQAPVAIPAATPATVQPSAPVAIPDEAPEADAPVIAADAPVSIEAPTLTADVVEAADGLVVTASSASDGKNKNRGGRGR